MNKIRAFLLCCVPLYTFLSLVFGAWITLGVLIFHIVVVPLIFKYSKTYQRMMIFGNFVQWPPTIDFEEPSAVGVEGARNLYIEFDSKVDQCKIKIGLWHVLPKSTYKRLKGIFENNDKEEINKAADEALASSKRPIIFYCHGNSNSRAASHRIKLYRFLQRLEYHTIAFDYRGYGDSTNLHPTEAGVVEDSLVVYEWLCTSLNKNGMRPPVFVWGHSLGTGISSHLLGNLEQLSADLLERPPLPLPNGLILECPFSNLADEVAEHPLAPLVTWLPYHDSTFLLPFRVSPEYTFRSDEYLARVKSLPVLIMHAKDDIVVPFILGVRLYRSILKSRAIHGGATIKFLGFEKKENLGHRYVCDAENLDQYLGEFVEDHL